MLPNPCLLLLTDRSRLSPNWTLAQAVAPAITGGCNVVVMRETDLPAGPRTTVIRFVQDGVKGRVPFLVAGDPAHSLAAGANGVLLDGEEEGFADARRVIGPNRLLGVSIRSREDAERAEAGGADFLLIEYDWSNPERVLRHFAELRADLNTPVVVGTDPPLDFVSALRSAGAAGVAVCAAAMSAYDRTGACGAYREALS